MEFTGLFNIPGMKIFFLDFEKASYFFLKCFEAFNFGSFFKNCANTLHRNIFTCVTNNEYASPLTPKEEWDMADL